MATKKTSKKATKKVTKKVKKVTKKAVKKVTKKATKKTATKKAPRKKASPSSSSSLASSSSTSSDFDRQDDFYTSPSPDAFSVARDVSDVSRTEEVEETSSRRIAILGIITVVILIALVIINKDKIFGGKTNPVVNNGKKVETVVKKGDKKPVIKKDVKPVVKKDVAVDGPLRTHTVVKGDGLYKIAKKYLGNGNRYKEIMKLNGLKKASDAKPGRKLKIPNK